jgi:hypothetical protein
MCLHVLWKECGRHNDLINTKQFVWKTMIFGCFQEGERRQYSATYVSKFWFQLVLMSLLVFQLGGSWLSPNPNVLLIQSSSTSCLSTTSKTTRPIHSSCFRMDRVPTIMLKAANVDLPSDPESPFVHHLPVVEFKEGVINDFSIETVDRVLDEIRPWMIADGGNIVVVDVDVENCSLSVMLQGACGSCSSSTVGFCILVDLYPRC